jgi:hypothetical protein
VNRLNRKNRGFAMLMALAMIGLVSITLVVLSQEFAFDMKRTQIVTRDAQLSQLLLAGAQEAMQRSRDWPETPRNTSWQIELPQTLSHAAAKLTSELHAAGDQKVDVTIEAIIASQMAVQTLHFKHTDRGWEVDSAELLGAK